MDSKVLEDAKFALCAGMNKPVLIYLEARLQEVKDSLVDASGDMVTKQQGRALELRELIKLMKTRE